MIGCTDCARLRADNERLAAEVRAWRDYAETPPPQPFDAGELGRWRAVLPGERLGAVKVLMILSARPGAFIGKAELLAAMGTDERKAWDEVLLQTATVQMCNARRTLRGLSAAGRLSERFAGPMAGIVNLYGIGWSMPEAEAQELRSLVERPAP